MKTKRNKIKADLHLLIDISCSNLREISLFEEFHRKLIKISYNATDVIVDYYRNRVYMSVLAEDESYDAMAVNKFADTICVNLPFKDLNDFLKSCILENLDSLSLCYPELISRFFGRETKEVAFESFDSVI